MVKRKVVKQLLKDATLNTVDSENMLKSNEFNGIVNLCVNEKGKLGKRPALNNIIDTTNYNDLGWVAAAEKTIGLFVKKIGTSYYIIFANGTTLFLKTDDGVNEDISGAILTDTTHGYRMKYIDIADTVNQSDNLYIIMPRDGANKTPLLPRKYLFKVNSGSNNSEDKTRTLAFPTGNDLRPSCTTTGSGVLNGTYEYVVTAVMNTGTETAVSASSSVSPSTQSVLVSIVNTQNGYIKYYKIYRTKVGTSTPYYYVATVTAAAPGGGTITYTDNIADTALGTEYYSDDKDFINYKATTGSYAYNRIFLTGDDTYPNTVLYSDAGKSDSLRASNLYTNVEFGSNPITNMEFFRGVLYLFQQFGGVWAVRETGSNDNPFIFQKISVELGCNTWNSVAKDENYLYFGFNSIAYKYNGVSFEMFNNELNNKRPVILNKNYNFTFFIDFFNNNNIVNVATSEDSGNLYEYMFNNTTKYLSAFKYGGILETEDLNTFVSADFIKDGFYCKETNRFYFTTYYMTIGFVDYSDFGVDKVFNGDTSDDIVYSTGVVKTYDFGALVTVNSIAFYGHTINTSLNNIIVNNKVKFYYSIDGVNYTDVYTCTTNDNGYELPINQRCKKIKIKVMSAFGTSSYGYFLDYFELKVSGLNNSVMKNLTSGGID